MLLRLRVNYTVGLINNITYHNVQSPIATKSVQTVPVLFQGVIFIIKFLNNTVLVFETCLIQLLTHVPILTLVDLGLPWVQGIYYFEFLNFGKNRGACRSCDLETLTEVLHNYYFFIYKLLLISLEKLEYYINQECGP
jgi:hypothetical protein